MWIYEGVNEKILSSKRIREYQHKRILMISLCCDQLYCIGSRNFSHTGSFRRFSLYNTYIRNITGRQHHRHGRGEGNSQRPFCTLINKPKKSAAHCTPARNAAKTYKFYNTIPSHMSTDKRQINECSIYTFVV
jgi:hypothetical protein